MGNLVTEKDSEGRIMYKTIWPLKLTQ
jgi:hypothetical protein